MSDQALCDRFTGIMADFTAYMAKHLPDDVVAKLKELRSQQNTELANIIYDTMFANQEAAARRNVPSCQDTGVIQYFIQCGSKFPLLGDLPKCLPEAAKLATQRAPLRHNAVQIFDEKNSGNNTGVRIPYLDWEIIPDSDECTIYAYLAGGGCSLPGHAKVFMPVEGYEAVVRFIFDLICDRGINACPPLLVGVGIAGSAEVAAVLSKKALLRPVGSHNSNPKGAEFERLIAEGLDKINIGCQVKILDIEYSEELDYKIVGSTEANSLKGKISNESPVGKALIGHKVGDTVEVETPAGVFAYKILEIQRSNVE